MQGGFSSLQINAHRPVWLGGFCFVSAAWRHLCVSYSIWIFTDRESTSVFLTMHPRPPLWLSGSALWPCTAELNDINLPWWRPLCPTVKRVSLETVACVPSPSSPLRPPGDSVAAQVLVGGQAGGARWVCCTWGRRCGSLTTSAGTYRGRQRDDRHVASASEMKRTELHASLGRNLRDRDDQMGRLGDDWTGHDRHTGCLCSS